MMADPDPVKHKTFSATRHKYIVQTIREISMIRISTPISLVSSFYMTFVNDCFYLLEIRKYLHTSFGSGINPSFLTPVLSCTVSEFTASSYVGGGTLCKSPSPDGVLSYKRYQK